MPSSCGSNYKGAGPGWPLYVGCRSRELTNALQQGGFTANFKRFRCQLSEVGPVASIYKGGGHKKGPPDRSTSKPLNLKRTAPFVLIPQFTTTQWAGNLTISPHSFCMKYVSASACIVWRETLALPMLAYRQPKKPVKSTRIAWPLPRCLARHHNSAASPGPTCIISSISGWAIDRKDSLLLLIRTLISR